MDVLRNRRSFAQLRHDIDRVFQCLPRFSFYGYGWNSGDSRSGGNIAGHDSVGADRSAVPDGNPTEHRHAAADPDLIADDDGFGHVIGVAKGAAVGARMVGVANTGVFPDHASLPDTNARISNQMHAGGEDDAVSDDDFAVAVGFQVLAGIDQESFSAADTSGAVHLGAT